MTSKQGKASTSSPFDKIVIPTLNGILEAGISAGVDPELGENEKLPVYVVGKNISSITRNFSSQNL